MVLAGGLAWSDSWDRVTETDSDTTNPAGDAGGSAGGAGGSADDADRPPGDTPSDADPTPSDADVTVHFLDVGQGDATLLDGPDTSVLVDTGRHDASDVTAHLERLDVDQLDVVVVTHPHADHLGQFDEVLDEVGVDEVWWSGAEHTTQTFDHALDALERSDAAYEEPRAGDATEVGRLSFAFANPPPGADFSDLHDSTLAFSVTYGQVGFVFTGYAEAPTEARMARTHPEALAGEVYQVGHHGSATSTTPQLLAAVDPAVAVWSAAEDSQYGHPHEEVLDRLDTAGVAVYGTATHGTVTVTTDGRSLEVAGDG